MKPGLYFAFFIAFLGMTSPVSAQHIGDSKIYYGVSYYPEVWNEDFIDQDITRMKELNMNVVHMAEFSWALMEPEEGRFEFKWLHDIVDKLGQNNIDVILGTPTATPPIWLATKHPEIFVTDADGKLRGHGIRRNCSYTSKIYREYSRIICEQLASEFANTPHVIGWQTDNEFHLTYDYGFEAKKAWHAWLKNKYGSVNELNTIWHTNLWSQRYLKFEQVPLPAMDTWHHPSLKLDWVRFTNDELVAYQNIQIDAIRKYSSAPITHDAMPGQATNYPKLFNDLDFMTTNVYHSFQVYNRVQSNYDRLRGYGKGMHWLFETTPNYSGGGNNGQTWFVHQPEGAMHAAMWLNYALGGQGGMFWLWRQQPAGQEMPHGAVISAWNKPAANYDDIKKLGDELNRFSDMLLNTPVAGAQAAIFYSHENDMGLRIEESVNNIKYYKDWAKKFYQPMSDAFIHRDVVSEYVDIDKYKLLVLPMMPMVNEALQSKLERWVKNGGTLLLGPMSGYRDEYWTAHTNYAMGSIEEWTGIHVEARIPIDAFTRGYDQQPQLIIGDEKATPEAELWCESLSSESGKILAQYKNGILDGQPAIIENKVGNGKVVLFGTYPGAECFQKMVETYARESEIDQLAAGDANVLVVPRVNEDNEYYIIINLNNQQAKIKVNRHIRKDLITGATINANELQLEPYQVIIAPIIDDGQLKTSSK